MNKKGLEFKSSFFALMAVSMVIVATGIIVGGWSDFYGSGVDYDLGEFDRTEDVYGNATDQQTKLSPTSRNLIDNFEASTFRGVFGIITTIYTPFKIVFADGGMIDSVTERFGIPNYVRQGLVTFIIVAFTFALVAVIFRLSRRSA